jgi:ligand-binding sensor domain-containing protein
MFLYNTRLLSLICLLLQFFWAKRLGAQTVFEHGAYKVDHFTEKDGLVSSEVFDTYKDHFGFLWVATFKGVSRFDGRQFENFTRANGLLEGNLEIMGEDAAGQMYFRSVSHVYRYTGGKPQAFYRYPGKIDRFITTGCPTNLNEAWVSYEGEHAVHLLDPSGIRATLKTDGPVYRMVRANSNEIYVLELSGKLWLLRQRELIPAGAITPIQPFTNEGIRIYRDESGRIWSYGANNRFIYSHSGTTIIDSIRIPTDTRWWQWWVGMEKRVYYASDTGSLFQLRNNRWETIFDRNQLKGSVYEVKEDVQGQIWITTIGGLFKASRKLYEGIEPRAPFSYYAISASGQYILRTDSALYQIPKAAYYCNQLRKEVLINVYVTRTKDVWYCTEEAVYQLPYGGSLKRLNTSETYEGNKSVFRFRRILEDEKGGIWISSYHGIFHAVGNALHYYWEREGLTEGAIYSIAKDRNGILYAAGINLYALVGDKFLNISQRLKLPNEITRLTTDREGNLWFTQENTSRICQLGFRNQQFSILDSVALHLNGLPFNASSAMFDVWNNLWVCDGRALFLFPKERSGYGKHPGYFEEDLTGSPTVYWGGGDTIHLISHPLAGNYLRRYTMGSLLKQYKRIQPAVHLIGLDLFKESFDWSRAGFTVNTVGIPQHPVLEPTQNFLRFIFTGITENFEHNMAYRYQLHGYDRDWSPSTSRNEAEYTGLPAGNYIFEVQARSSGGEWSGSVRYAFSIREFWYDTLWAKAIWIAMAFLLVGGLVYLRIRSLKRKAKLSQTLVEEQLKALRAQINPHFLQNTFAFLAHELYLSNNSKAVKALDQLSIYLKNVLRFSDQTSTTLEEEIEFAGEYLEMQRQILSISFEYEIVTDEEVDLFDIQVPAMLFQPLIENAIKYGLDPNKPNTITVKIVYSYPYVKCTISDTGRTAPVAETLQYGGSGKGLMLTRERMELYYREKKNPPQLYRQKNVEGGCSVLIFLPIE